MCAGVSSSFRIQITRKENSFSAWNTQRYVNVIWYTNKLFYGIKWLHNMLYIFKFIYIKEQGWAFCRSKNMFFFFGCLSVTFKPVFTRVKTESDGLYIYMFQNPRVS